MSVQQLLSHLGDCRRRLSDLGGRQNYLALSCAMLRLEGAGGTVLYDRPFVRILNDRPFHDRLTASHGDTFAVAFYPPAAGIQTERIPAALAPVDAITGEIHPLLRELPRPVHERLRLPDSDDWWRIVFHLGWHFPRPFLRPVRRRLLAREGAPAWSRNETIVQLHGTGGHSDLFPGLIYSNLEHDLCTCSEAAVGVIIEALERHAQTGPPAAPGAQAVSADQRRAFDRLRDEFPAGMQMPAQSLECKLLKLADSFDTPPASEWAGLEVGGCVERFLTLSRLNDMQEIAQIRGPATGWFCQVAERAGDALPACISDCPILFDDIQRGFGGPCPVMNRGPLERWIGFVFATLKRYGNEALRVWWGTNLGPLSYGLATLDRDLCAASVLAIDLARLSTAAEAASSRERASCSPFSVPSMEEQGFQFAEDTPPPPSPPENYTLGQLVEYLRRFGENYHQSTEHIRQEDSAVQRGAWVQLGAFVSQARESLQGVPGFTELRELARSWWGEEISFAVGRRIVDALVERSNGSLAVGAAEGLTLAEAFSRLSAPPGTLATPVVAPPEEPADDTDQEVKADDVDRPAGKPMLIAESGARMASDNLNRTGDRLKGNAELLDEAARRYAADAGSIWLAAFPDGLTVDRCDAHDASWGEVSRGRVAFPWGCMYGLGVVNLGEHGSYRLLSFLPLAGGASPDELERFGRFAAEAGAALVADPPAWGMVSRAGDPASTWVAALMFLAPAAAGYVVERKGGCRLIAQPWAASVAALRDWGSKSPAPHIPPTIEPAASVRDGTDQVEKSDDVDLPAAKRVPQPRPVTKEPSKDAITVYRYWFASSCVLSDRKTQTQLAEDPNLMQLLGRKVDQGTISRMLRKVKDWIEAGNVLPDLSEPLESKPTPMDPERIDLGQNRERRPKHQRKRRTSDSDE
jgi:hypothetical protein